MEPIWGRRNGISSSKEVQESNPTVSGDLDYFRTKPTKNWRIRPKQAGERLLLNAKISGDPDSSVIVFRARHFEDSRIFLKALVTPGPHNDVADPWMYIGDSAIRASLFWKRFQNASLAEGFEILISQLEEDAWDNNGFEEWCLQDINRTARLAWSVYAETPVVKKFSDDLKKLGDWKFMDIGATFAAAVEKTESDSSELLERSIPLLAGWKISHFLATHDSATLEPTRELIDAIAEDSDYASVPVALPYPSILVDVKSINTRFCYENLERHSGSVHGFIFSNFIAVGGERILQIGRLEIDGLIRFAEVEIVEDTTWDAVAAAAHENERYNKDWEPFEAALRVLATYTLHRKSNPASGRRVGIEILPPNHRHAPKKEIPIVTVQNVQKPTASAPITAAPRTPISEILEKIQAAYEARHEAHRTRIEELRRALDVYAEYAKNDLAVDFARRNGVEDAGDLRAPDAALYLSVLIDQLPEMGGRNSETREKAGENPVQQLNAVLDDNKIPAIATLVAAFSKIRARGPAEQVVLIGGKPVREKMPWLKETLGYEPEWINTHDEAGSAESQKLGRRLTSGGVLGVIFFQSFMGHRQTDPLLEAGRASGVPVVAGGRAGHGEIARALASIEEKL